MACETARPEVTPAFPLAPGPTQVTQSVIPDPSDQLQPITLTPGQQVQVAVYPDAPSDQAPCFDLLPYLVPASAAGQLATNVIPCTSSLADRARLQFVATPDGVLYVHKVQLLLRPTPSLPDAHSQFCDDLVQFLLPASAPISAGRGRMVCWSEPLAGGHEHIDVIEVWSDLRVEPPVQHLPDGVHCWELIPYLGPPFEGIQTRPQKCILN